MEASVAKKTEAKVPAKVSSGWGRSEVVDARDVLIPKLLIMQPISKDVVDGKFKGGVIIRSTAGAEIPQPLHFIPLLYTKSWVIQEKVGNKFEFRRREPFSAANADAPWHWEADATKGRGKAEFQRSQSIDCFALLPGDIEREAKAFAALEKTGELPDADDALLPVAISFTRTSFQTGRALVTHFAKMESFGVPGCAQTLTLKTRKEDGELGSYFVFEMGKGRKTSAAELEAAKKWWTIINSSKAKIDDRDLEGGEEAAPHPAGKSAF